MLKIDNLVTSGWEAAIRGMRNPMNSWAKGDSIFYNLDKVSVENRYKIGTFELGPNDLDLACRLIKAGPEHAKFLRMIHVQMDITAPLYWWKEMDTYKVATVANSCSTMHKIHAKEFELSDFSYENLDRFSIEVLEWTIKALNTNREDYIESKDKKTWWQLIQLLPSSYNQLRTWDGNMETILSILHQRAHHKLDTDWEPFRQVCFENIPYCKEFYEAMYSKDDKE